MFNMGKNIQEKYNKQKEKINLYKISCSSNNQSKKPVKIQIKSTQNNNNFNRPSKNNKNHIHENKFLDNKHKEKEEKKNEPPPIKQRNLSCLPNKNKISLTPHIKNFKIPPLITILNNGKTTYITCILQILANIRNIASHYLKKIELYRKEKENVKVSFLLSEVFLNLFPSQEEEKTVNKNKYSVKHFHEEIIKINSAFKGRSTKNIIDFLVFALNILDKEDLFLIKKENKNCKDENYMMSSKFHNFFDYVRYLKYNEDSIIFKTFSWINKKKEFCWQCRKEIINYQKYFTYDLDVYNAINKILINNKKELSIMDCISYSNENKNIYNNFCRNCKNKSNFSISSSIYLSQSLLIFLLKGMESLDMIKKIRDNNINIKIDENLDLTSFIENEQSHKQYTLHAIVLYDTKQLEYTAYCVSPIDKCWYKYSNSNITKTEFKNFINSFGDIFLPVILFYRHV